MKQELAEVSHQFSRAFRPECLTPPRGFDASLKDLIRASAPVVLEIGAGKGKHALEFGSRYAQLFVAVERTKVKFEAFAKQLKAAQAGSSAANVRAVHADAVSFCVHALAPNSVSKVYVLYPNPEPANPQQRWLNMPFFEFLLSRLVDGGEVVLATNIQTYAEEALTQATEVWKLKAQLEEVLAGSNRTHFETKYLERGMRCLQLNLTKPLGYRTRFDSFAA